MRRKAFVDVFEDQATGARTMSEELIYFTSLIIEGVDMFEHLPFNVLSLAHDIVRYVEKDTRHKVSSNALDFNTTATTSSHYSSSSSSSSAPSLYPKLTEAGDAADMPMVKICTVAIEHNLLNVSGIDILKNWIPELASENYYGTDSIRQLFTYFKEITLIAVKEFSMPVISPAYESLFKINLSTPAKQLKQKILASWYVLLLIT